jgi:tetratricopeptide (TPR) repeat protein
MVLPLLNPALSGNELFSTSWGAAVSASRGLAGLPSLAIRLGLSYSHGGLLPASGTEVPGSLDELGLFGGLVLTSRIAPAFDLHGGLDAGFGYGFLSSGTSAPYAILGLGFGLGFRVSGELSLSLDVAGLYKFGLYGAASLGLGLAYRLPEPAIPAGTRVRLLDFPDIRLEPVFPVLRSYYDEGSLGKLTLRNSGREAAVDVHVTVFIRQYMDAPRECAVIARLEPGQSMDVSLHALFNDAILAVTEATKVAAQVNVTYRGGEASQATTVVVYDRNALTWKDDRMAAAFVSSKDPWVLDLSGNILAAAKSVWNPELPKNLQTAIAFHEGLRTYGMGYMLSPNRPFAVGAADLSAVDSLKFPRQSLGYRSGDCADLSVLYASFFEAAGIETAFVTVPGHIFMAFNLELSAESAAARGMDLRELIVKGGKVWVPVETTTRDSGFLEAWRKAAAEWRASAETGSAAFYPVHDAWAVYAPVGLPADGSTVVVPDKDALLKGFRPELAKAVEAELGARLSAARAAGGAPAKLANDLGVIYAKYGRYPEAKRQFEAASGQGYAAATLNIGNLAYLRGDYETALAAYQKASAANPGSAKILVNLARAAAGLGKTDLVNSTLASLRALDPKLAGEYSGLAAESQAAAQGARAANAGDAGPLWF